MKTRTKILITIVLAVIYWALTQALLNPPQHAFSTTVSLTAAQLKKLYDLDNNRFFDSKLPKNVVIDYNEMNPLYMATTNIMGDGLFHISLNPDYAKAERVEEYLLLHEACHIKTWSDTLHGPKWRTCMLGLDAQGALREIFVDNYQEKIK